MNTILRAKNIHKSYKMGKARLEVLKGVDMTVPKGQLVAIVGASGCGKSTLLHILGALDTPDQGDVEFDGQNLKTFRWSKRDQFRNKKVGFVFQFYHLLDELSVLENVLVPAMASTGTLGWFNRRAKAEEKAKVLLDRFGLKERLRHKPYELSGGERQRVAIARALINDPPLLLADEPTGNLDSRTGNGILEALKDLNAEGQTMIMVTHDERIAAQAQTVIRLVDGKIKKAE
ncbi:MAG: ABC transporter ATP-binding protein [Planctomycetes bacterium]|nr:ABC transporter ATP-binding protein [Planctomycetota bacterium]